MSPLTRALGLSREKLAPAARKFKLEHQIAETQAQIAKLEGGG